MKKIVFLATHYGKLGQASSLRTTAMARRLDAEGYNVVVLIPSLSHRNLIKTSSRFEFDGDIQIIYLSGSGNNSRTFFSRIVHELTVAVSAIRYLWSQRPHTIIASYPPAFTPLIGLIWSKILKIRFVFEIRDLMADALTVNQYTKSKILLRFAKLYENFLIKRSSIIALASPGMCHPVLSINNNTTILRAFNGIENTTLDFDSDTLPASAYSELAKVKKKLNLSPNDKLVIYAGALTQSYDIQTIIDGFNLAAIENVKLLILGDGEKKVEYINFCVKNNISNVIFYDFVDRRVALELMKISSVGVHAFSNSPHWSYVLGNKVFDYMAVGLPVLFSGMGTTADLVIDSGGGKVSNPSSPNDFAKNLREMINDENLVSMGLCGKDFVNKNWTREKQLDYFIADLTEVSF